MGPTNGELEKVCKQLGVIRGHAHGIFLAAWVLHCAELAANETVEVGTLLELGDLSPTPVYQSWHELWAAEDHTCEHDDAPDLCRVCQRETLIITAAQLLEALPERKPDATP